MRGEIEDKVKIGEYEYDIRYVEELKNDGGEDLYGQIDYPKCVIRIREEYRDSQRIAQILWHEILHGIIEAAGVEQGEDGGEAKVEDVIRVLSPGIVSVLRANRWLGGL